MTADFREINLHVPTGVVWEVLTAPGLREWYYRLTPHGEFAPGSHIRWVDTAGSLVEESDVIHLEPGKRLGLRTRFLFASSFAAAQPHTVDWELTPEAEGSRVRLSWSAVGPPQRLLESEADSMLAGLRLEADPAARTELARLLKIGEVDVRDVSPDRVSDYQAFFDRDAFRDYPAWQSCYCMETHRTQGDDEWAERTAGDNRNDMSELLSQGRVSALLAYADGKPVGWCNYGETTRLSGLVRRFGLEAGDYDGVGSVACFVIAAQYRGHGIASHLLDAAIDRLRARGLSAVEGYPARTDDSTHGNYRGPLSMFLRAGFEPYREIERHIVVRKTL